MSTQDESPYNEEIKKRLRDSLLLFKARTDDKTVQALVETQEENTEVKDDRKEERFLWICFSVVLFDCAFFMNAQNFAGPLMVGIIELLALIVLARRMGVQEVKEIVYGLIDRLRKTSGE